MAEKVKYGDLPVLRYGYEILNGLNYKQASSRVYRKSGASSWEDRGIEGIPMPGRNRAVRHYIDAFILGAVNGIGNLDSTGNTYQGAEIKTVTWPMVDAGHYYLYGSGLHDVGKGWNGKERKAKAIGVLFTAKGLNTAEETEEADRKYAERQEEIRQEKSDAQEKLKNQIQARLDALDGRYRSDAAEAERKSAERKDEYGQALADAKTDHDATVREIEGKELTEGYGEADRDMELDEALLKYEAERYGIETGYATHEDGSRMDGKAARLKQEMVAERLDMRREYVAEVAKLSHKAETDLKAAKATRYDALKKSAAVQLERQMGILKEECDGLFLGMGCLDAMERRRRILTEQVALTPISTWLSSLSAAGSAFPVSRQRTCVDEVMARYADLEATRVLREDNGGMLNLDDRIHGSDEDASVTVKESGQRWNEDGDSLVNYTDSRKAWWEVGTLSYSRTEWTEEDANGKDCERYFESDETPTKGCLVLYVGNVATSYRNARRIRRIVGDVIIETSVRQEGAATDDERTSVTVRHARVEFAFDRVSKDLETLSGCHDKVVEARKRIYEDARTRYGAVARTESRLIESMKKVDADMDELESELAAKVSEREREVNEERMGRIDALVSACNSAIASGTDGRVAMDDLCRKVTEVNKEMDESIEEMKDECSARLSKAREDALERRKKISDEADKARDEAQTNHAEARREIEKGLNEELSVARSGFKDGWSNIGWERWTADVAAMMKDAMVRPSVIRDTELKSGTVRVKVRLLGPYNLTAEVEWLYLTGGDFAEYVRIAEEEYIKETTGTVGGDQGDGG